MYRPNTSMRHDPEDKDWWLNSGERLEHQFVQMLATEKVAKVELNPDKLNDPTAPDLLLDGQLADLKSQRTPFFSANRYSKDPRWTVTYNRKDLERYASLYPNIQILFWVVWEQLSYHSYSVEPLSGVWLTSNAEILARIKAGAPEHRYVRRQEDQLGNAKSSFLLDLREMKCLIGGDGGVGVKG